MSSSVFAIYKNVGVLRVELVDSGVETSSPATASIAEPRIDELTGLWESTRVGDVSLLAKFANLVDTRDRTDRELKKLMRRIRTEIKTLDDHVVAEQDGAFSRCHGVLLLI